jgi:hypothetical protein
MKGILLGILALLIVPMLVAATPVPPQTNIVVTPTTATFDSNNVVGVSGDAAPGYPTGSFASDGSGKTDIYFSPAVLFGRSVTLGEIASMSYFTKKGTTHVVNPADWALVIYTVPFDGDLGSWYGERIGAEPYFSINMNDPVDTWNEWSTGGSSNQLRFYESTSGYFGSYTDPVWSTFVTGTGLSGLPYTNHTVLTFSVQTGTAWADGFTGQIDGLRIELTDGSVATVNFENDESNEVPEFGLIAGAIALAGLVAGVVVLRKRD